MFALARRKRLPPVTARIAVVFAFIGSVVPASCREADEPTDDLLAAAAIRRMESNHLTLYTDIRETPAVDDLPRVFDLAVPQWCAYFEIPEARARDWHMTACIMRDAATFQRVGLMPGDLPSFLTGYQRGARLWMHEQPSDYYRQHLLLHEGTHGFTVNLLGGGGPPWYMEGIAEYLALHRWRDGKLELAHNPSDASKASHWGRIKILKQECAAGRSLSLIDVMKYDSKAHLRLEPYAWCWAAVMFLDNHPDYQGAFRACRADLADTSVEFSRKLYRRLESDWPDVELNWQAYIASVEYGYDVRQAAIGLKVESPSIPGSGSVDVWAARGWQWSGLRVAADQTYRLSASGRCQVALKPDPWWSEANGITLHYYRGRPLGMLLAAVVPDDQPARIGEPVEVGIQTEFRTDVAGRLFFKINESGADLSDNDGQLTVRVEGPSPR